VPILFDLDGVFYQGSQAIEGGAEVALWVQKNNIPHLFITNTSSKPRSALLSKLASFGINTDESHIFTPPIATAHWLRQQSLEHEIALFMPEATQADFAGFDIWQGGDKPVSAIIIGDLGEQWTFQVLNKAFRLLMQQSQPQFIALGMTRYWQAGDGLRLDVAPFIVALEYATGIKAQVMGKPASAFFQSAIDILGSTAEQTIMIGDDIRSDVAGAQNAGLQGVLVKTGKYRPDDLQQGIQPDAILSSIRDLPEWWNQQSNLSQHKNE